MELDQGFLASHQLQEAILVEFKLDLYRNFSHISKSTSESSLILKLLEWDQPKLDSYPGHISGESLLLLINHRHLCNSLKILHYHQEKCAELMDRFSQLSMFCPMNDQNHERLNSSDRPNRLWSLMFEVHPSYSCKCQ